MDWVTEACCNCSHHSSSYSAGNGCLRGASRRVKLCKDCLMSLNQQFVCRLCSLSSARAHTSPDDEKISKTGLSVYVFCLSINAFSGPVKGLLTALKGQSRQQGPAAFVSMSGSSYLSCDFQKGSLYSWNIFGCRTQEPTKAESLQAATAKSLPTSGKRTGHASILCH